MKKIVLILLLGVFALDVKSQDKNKALLVYNALANSDEFTELHSDFNAFVRHYRDTSNARMLYNRMNDLNYALPANKSKFYRIFHELQDFDETENSPALELYHNLISDEKIKGIPSDFKEFKNALKDTTIASEFYDQLVKDGYESELPEDKTSFYEMFNSNSEFYMSFEETFGHKLPPIVLMMPSLNKLVKSLEKTDKVMKPMNLLNGKVELDYTTVLVEDFKPITDGLGSFDMNVKFYTSYGDSNITCYSRLISNKFLISKEKYHSEAEISEIFNEETLNGLFDSYEYTRIINVKNRFFSWTNYKNKHLNVINISTVYMGQLTSVEFGYNSKNVAEEDKADFDMDFAVFAEYVMNNHFRFLDD